MIALIGTAGRDNSRPHTRHLWLSMLDDAMHRVPLGSHLVSGGAAWADHLAVRLFLTGYASGLDLHLPAEFETAHRFRGERGTAGGAANFYHMAFSAAVGINSVLEIIEAINRGARYTTQATAPGMSAFKTRNRLVAAAATTGALAYTWGDGAAPADGGTLHTWRLISAPKTHVPLAGLQA